MIEHAHMISSIEYAKKEWSCILIYNLARKISFFKTRSCQSSADKHRLESDCVKVLNNSLFTIQFYSIDAAL